MALTWSSRRKLLYLIVGGVVLLVLFFVTYQSAFNQAPSCFDGKQNQDEHGVDCGGDICKALCQSEARQPVVLWSRAFQTGQQTYTAAAYIQNPNVGAAARRVGYSFQLFDTQNKLVVEQQGTIDIPPVQTVPIILPNINVGNRAVAKALFAFTTTPAWQKVSGLPSLRVKSQFLARDGSRLSATIANDSSQDAKNIAVTAVLFDASGTARAASKSLLSHIPRHGAEDINFTWPQGVEGIVQAEITTLPAF